MYTRPRSWPLVQAHKNKMEETLMKKVYALILIIAMIACFFAGCSNSATQGSTNETTAALETTAAQSEAETTAEASAAPIKIAVIVKSTDSESWQYMLTGARNAAADSNGAIVITEHGAASETDISGQVSILEDVIVEGPDAIVVTPSDSDALNAALEEARDAGIKIIVVDTSVTTDAYDMFMANDNYAGGELIAEQMVKYLNEANIELKGSIGIVSAVPVQTVYDRDDGFIDKMAELAPDVKIISGNYVDNDMQKSMDLTLDYITANDDLIGVYGDNNVTGSGIALAIAELGVQDEVIGVAYDGNPEEVAGVRSGALKAILVQDLYNWGYQGVNFAYSLVNGENLESYFNTGVTLVTMENIDNDEIQDVLDPSRLAR